MSLVKNKFVHVLKTLKTLNGTNSLDLRGTPCICIIFFLSRCISLLCYLASSHRSRVVRVPLSRVLGSVDISGWYLSSCSCIPSLLMCFFCFTNRVRHSWNDVRDAYVCIYIYTLWYTKHNIIHRAVRYMRRCRPRIGNRNTLIGSVFLSSFIHVYV